MNIEEESQDLVSLKAQSQILQGSAIKTGLGNLLETKKMKSEPDVFKNLKVGQAVLIDKIKTSQDLFQIFNLKE